MEQEIKESLSAQNSSPKKKNIWLWIIGGCLGLAILGGLAFLALGWWGVKKVRNEMKDVNFEEKINEWEKDASGVQKGADEPLGTSIKDWIQKKTGVKCEINDPESGKMSMMAKNDKIKIEGFEYASPNNPAENNRGTMISDGEWMYMWSGKDGIKFNIKEMERMGSESGSETSEIMPNNSWDDWASQMETGGASYDCQPASLSDADFKIPDSVNFSDWGKQMEQFLNFGKDIQDNLPKY